MIIKYCRLILKIIFFFIVMYWLLLVIGFKLYNCFVICNSLLLLIINYGFFFNFFKLLKLLIF